MHEDLQYYYNFYSVTAASPKKHVFSIQ